jgi:hypothetical protein
VNYPIIKHEVLGCIKYNNEFDWYQGQIVFHKTQISISIEDTDKLELVLTRASSVIENLEHHVQDATEYAAEKLLKLKNEIWLDKDEAFLTTDEFKNRIKLDGVVFSPDGEVEFYYKDGNLFFGHFILVKMDKFNYFINTSICG